jgi:DNA-binding NarL/FixJ family response regulator
MTDHPEDVYQNLKSLPTAPQSGGRILIADDEPLFMQLTTSRLQKAGFECIGASDAESAFNLLQDLEFDLLISDIRMPGNDNLEFIREIRTLTEQLPVILVTGYPTLESAVESVRLQVVAYLIKPFSYEILVEEVKSAISMRRLFQAVRRLRTRVENWNLSLEQLESPPLPGDRQPHGISRQLGPQTSSPLNGCVTVNSFLDITFQNILNSLMDIRSLTSRISVDHNLGEACHLLNCPRLSLLMDSLVETIDVLEKTKGAFRSKDLGNLRKKLEMIVNSTKGLTGNITLP